MKELAILGGGPAGLGVAYYSQIRGLSFRIFEKEPYLGGLCRTLNCGGHSFDTGAHRFHNRDPEVTQDLMELMGDQLSTVSKPSKVLISGRFLDFPPTPINMLRFAGIKRIGQIGFDLIRSRWNNKEVRSFADFANQKFGRTLAELFLTNYSEKVWGFPSEELSPVIATRRLSGMNLKTLVKELFSPSKKTSHLDGQFLYPRGGYGKIVENLIGKIPSDRVRLNHPVVGLESESERITKILFADGTSFDQFDQVVSTLPINLLTRFLSKKTEEDLRFRSIRLIFIRLGQPSFTQYASLYVPDRKFCISRIYEPRNRCETMSPAGETGIVVECPCFQEDNVGEMAPEELFNRVVDELLDLRILDRQKIIEWQHHFLPNAYPVYTLDYQKKLDRSLDLINRYTNLDTLGRNGAFFYSHLHDQLRFGKDYVSGLMN
jgi:protoporphyrinogen oxidase